MKVEVKKKVSKAVQVNEGEPRYLIGYCAIIDGKKLTVTETRRLMRHHNRHKEREKCEECKKGIAIAKAVLERKKKDEENTVGGDSGASS